MPLFHVADRCPRSERRIGAVKVVVDSGQQRSPVQRSVQLGVGVEVAPFCPDLAQPFLPFGRRPGADSFEIAVS